MFAKLNHLAIVSDNYAGLGIFYRAVFGLKSKDHARFEASALSLSDGYLGMNINPRMAGRQAGIDHFGIQVEDVETVRERVAKRYPNIGIIQRPSNRPFAGMASTIPPAITSICLRRAWRTAPKSMRAASGSSRPGSSTSR